MSVNPKLATALACLVGLGLIASGCARVPGHQGFVADTVLLDSVQPGVDNRASVEKSLGRPTFVGQFNTNEWFYVARETKQLAFALPKPTQQMVMRIRFDGAGNVAAVDRAGLEKIAKINIEDDKTPTLGRKRGFFEDLFGNIGQVGAIGQGAGSADNPDGN